MRRLEEFLRPSQKGLFKMLCKQFTGKAYKCDKSFILVEGEAPIMLVAHLDTVHQEPVREICKSKGGNILMSPQGIGGDDRCGVYALVNAYEMSKKKPWLLFTCDEEIGCVGADTFCHMHQDNKLPLGVDSMKCLIEIDRRGNNDAVYYDCDNKDFEKYITSKGFKTAYGSCSDISSVAPELGVAAVNLSSGYYNAHTLHEYINRDELDDVLRRVIDIIADAAKDDFPYYEYVEKVYSYHGYEPGVYAKYYGYAGLQKWEAASNAFTKSTETKTTSVSSDGTVTMTVTVKDDPDPWELTEEEEGWVCRALPTEYEELYDELLTLYTKDELEEERARYGDRVIYELYVEAFGPFYSYDQK